MYELHIINIYSYKKTNKQKDAHTKTNDYLNILHHLSLCTHKYITKNRRKKHIVTHTLLSDYDYATINIHDTRYDEHPTNYINTYNFVIQTVTNEQQPQQPTTIELIKIDEKLYATRVNCV